MALKIESRKVGDNFPLLEPVGEIDVYSAPEVRAELANALETGGHQAAISLARVTFIDSRGIGVLAEATKRARRHGGDLAIVCANERFLRHIGILKLSEFFTIVPTEEVAVERLARSGGEE